MNIRRLSFFAFAAAVGISTFGLLWLPKTMAAAPTNCVPAPGTATMCYKGSTVTGVPQVLQKEYLANGGTCGACTTTQTKL